MTSLSQPNTEVIVVTGTGVAIGVPDAVEFSFGIAVIRSTINEAGYDVERESQRVIAALVSNGVLERNIRITSATVYPKYETNPDYTSRVVGYTCERTYVVHMAGTSIGLAEKAMRTALIHGANKVESLNWIISPRAVHRLCLEALRLANEAARTKAELLAKELGYSLGGLVGATEGAQLYSHPHYMIQGIYTTPASLASQHLTPKASVATVPGGSVTETVNVTLVFKLGAPLDEKVAPSSNQLSRTIPTATKYPLITPPDDPLFTWKDTSVVSKPPLPSDTTKLAELPLILPAPKK